MLLINKTLIEMSKGIRGWIAIITAIKLAIMVATIEFAKIVSVFLGDLFNPSMTSDDFISAITSAFIVSVFLVVCNIILGEAEYYCSSKARLNLRGTIIDKLFKVDITTIETIGAVSAINTTGQGVENVQVYYSKYLPTLFFCIVTPFYLFFQLANVSILVAIILFIISILILPANNIFKSLTEKMKTGYWKSLQDMTSHYLENIKGLTTLKLFNRDEDKSESLKEKVEIFNLQLVDVMKLNFYSVALTFTMMYVGIFISIIIACVQLYNGDITISSALMILMLSFSFFASFKELIGATHNALSGVSASQNIHELLSIDTSRKSAPKSEKPIENAIEGIEFCNIEFNYPNRPNVLKNISLIIPKGKTTALVGSSGSGKSTISSLLLRFIDPSNGTVYLNGYNYLSFDPEVLRKEITIVPQTVTLFNGTIEENLKIANENATEEEMYEALRNVHLEEWVLKQPLKLKTDVGDSGSKLSGGQKQKIGIARALLSNAEYIIFDEATSSVDLDSEKEIWNCIDNLSHQKSLIIISHRLSTIKNSDVIYVLNKGDIDNKGTHDELMTTSEIYKNLVNEQAALEKIGERGGNNE